MNTTQTGQLEQANEALVSLAQNVAPSDRSAARDKYSDYTIVQYLAGRGKNLDTAMDLLRLFRERIELRNKELQS